MQKKLLFLPLFLFVFYAGKAQLVITEIMYNPPESGTDSLEFIEIYNAGNTNYSLLNHSFFYTNGKRYTFTTDSIMAPKSLLILAVSNANAVRRQYKLDYTPLAPTTSIGISNTSSTIKLLGASDQTLDSVTYSNSWGANANGSSLHLCNVASDNALAENWAVSTTMVGTTINTAALRASPGILEECALLPVTWLKVGIQEQTKGTATLHWQVQEIDVLNYHIEQSNDGINFNGTGSLLSKGEGINNYQFTANISTGSYLRIKQVDKNGTFSYSKVLAAKSDAIKVVAAVPNPTKGIVVVSVNEVLAKETFFLYNQQGMLLQTIKSGKQIFEVNLSTYSNGVYYIKSESGKGVNIVKY